jgi:hypothetical protein
VSRAPCRARFSCNVASGRVSVEILGQRFEPIAAGLFMIARGLTFRDVNKGR